MSEKADEFNHKFEVDPATGEIDDVLVQVNVAINTESAADHTQSDLINEF